MERLTIPDEPIEGGMRRTIMSTRAVREEAMTLYWVLKSYEDTGLAPEQIREIDQLYAELSREVQQYREIGTVEEIKTKLEELDRWHTCKTVDDIKNPFANTSTLICANCDHKDDYIVELEAERDRVIKELRDRICQAEKVIVKNPHDKLDEIANDTAKAFVEAYKDAIEIVKGGDQVEPGQRSQKAISPGVWTGRETDGAV